MGVVASVGGTGFNKHSGKQSRMQGKVKVIVGRSANGQQARTQNSRVIVRGYKYESELSNMLWLWLAERL